MEKTHNTNCNLNKLVSETVLSTPLLKIDEEDFNSARAFHYNLSPQFVEYSPACHVISTIHNPVPLIKRRIGGICKDESIQPGDISIMPVNITHSAYWDQEVLLTTLLLKPEFIANIAYEDIDPDRVELLPTLAQSDPVISGIAQGLKLQLDSGNPISQMYFDQLAFTIAVHLLEYYCPRSYKLLETNRTFSTDELQQVLDYFDSHIDKQIGLSEISNLLGMSQNHFGRLFKKSIGTPPAQYLMKRRLKKAAYLLSATNSSLETIATRTGFANSSQFCKAFQRHISVTPRQYRTML
jgi:AraC family transcriptional regulator